MRRQPVFVVAEPGWHLEALIAAITAVGLEGESCAGRAALPAGLLPHRTVFYASDGTPEHCAEVSRHLRSSAQLGAIVPQADLARFVGLLRTGRCQHVIAAEAEAEAEGFSAAALVARKLAFGDLFGIEKYLPQGSSVDLVRLQDYAGRGRALAEIGQFAAHSGVRRALRLGLVQVCEELLMNALYDAPVDERGRALFADVAPKQRLELRSPRPVSIRYGATDDLFAVAVRDRYGALRKAVLLDYLEKCLTAPQQIDRKALGAGLGLYQIANSATELVFNIAPGTATEVVCTFDRRQTKAPLRLMSIYVHPRPAARHVG